MALEYVALAFNQDNFLVGLSGLPDFHINLWNWAKAVLVCSVKTNMTVSDQLRISSADSFSSHCLLQYRMAQASFSPMSSGGHASKKLLVFTAEDESERPLAVWKVKRCGHRQELVSVALPWTAEDNAVVASCWQGAEVIFGLTSRGTFLTV